MALPAAAANGAASSIDQVLVDRVKVLCRTDPNAKSKWCTWCDRNMRGTKDPGRMDAESLNLFFTEYEAGTLQAQPAPLAQPAPGVPPPPAAVATPPPAPKGTGRGVEQAGLAEAVKVGQRASAAWKATWKTYCTLKGNGIFDPVDHTKEFLQAYLQFLGTQAANALDREYTPQQSYESAVSNHVNHHISVNAPPPPVHPSHWHSPPQQTASGPPPPAKRPCTGSGIGPDPALMALAEQVKQLQKTDPVRKQQWADFCDASAGGFKDPMRHNAETLQAFLQQCTSV